jgi:glucose/arabinose dehydrogenase
LARTRLRSVSRSTIQRFPAAHRGGAFIGQHGSWNRSRFAGYKVIFVPFQGDRPSGPSEDFPMGFIADEAKSEVYGRPVGLAVLPDGSLLVADDGGNVVWRVTYILDPARRRRARHTSAARA